jgi:hypothetical protein
MFLLRFPFADFTLPVTINDREVICGEYWYPLRSYMRSGWERQRGFCRQADGRWDTFAVPVEHNADQLVIANPASVNNKNKVVGTWKLMTVPANIEGPTHSFLYDNGQFTELLVPGTGSDTHALYINNDDQIVLWSNGFWLNDDGRNYRINSPDGYHLAWIEGIDDFSRLAATLYKFSCQTCPPQRFNAILTPQ